MNQPTVCFFYLVPAGLFPRDDYLNAIRSAALDVQRWYWEQLQNGSSFRLNDPIVQVIQTGNPDWWYAQNHIGENQSVWFWLNALNDGYAGSGVSPNDPTVASVFYIDADHAPGQIGGAGLQGRAVLHRGDLLGLIGQNVKGACRWVGGMAHELGHVFGLDHPPNCQNHQAGDWEHPCQSLMYLGYQNYPRTYLLEGDLALLRQSKFFGPVTPNRGASMCTGERTQADASGRGRGRSAGRRVDV
jgi:hypothetical protein